MWSKKNMNCPGGIPTNLGKAEIASLPLELDVKDSMAGYTGIYDAVKGKESYFWRDPRYQNLGIKAAQTCASVPVEL